MYILCVPVFLCLNTDLCSSACEIPDDRHPKMTSLNIQDWFVRMSAFNVYGTANNDRVLVADGTANNDRLCAQLVISINLTNFAMPFTKGALGWMMNVALASLKNQTSAQAAWPKSWEAVLTILLIILPTIPFWKSIRD